MRPSLLFTSILALAALSALAPDAKADPAPAESVSITPTPVARPAAPDVWYGSTPLLVDLGSVALAVAGAAARSEPLAILGGGGYSLGAPMIHLAHHHPGRALASLALRLVGPALAGATLGTVALFTTPSDSDGGWGQAINMVAATGLGAISGAVLAIAIDDALLAREPARPAAPPDLRPTIEPRIASVQGGATFGVGGTF